MNYIVQSKLVSNPLYIRYLRENSHWYKILSRNPLAIDQMIEEMKARYQMRTSDKISNVVDSVSLISKIIGATKD